MPLGSSASLATIHPAYDTWVTGFINRTIDSDFSIEITIRRGNTTLSAQKVKLINQFPTAHREQSFWAEQSDIRVMVIGKTTLDIQNGDRFTTPEGLLVEVIMVRPNQQVYVLAEARAVE